MKSYLEKHRRFFGIVGGMIAFVVAIIYLKVIPEEASTVSGLQKIILVYGHSLCWILLCGASILWAIIKKNKWSRILAYAALATYIIFMSTLLIIKLL